MRLAELAPAPYRRARACAGPCPRCGSDGAHHLVEASALAREVTLHRGATLARVGLWLSVPDGERALHVRASGPAVARGLVEPTAARLRHALDLPDARASVALTRDGDARVGVLVAPSRRERLAGVAVLELAGTAAATGCDDLHLELAAARGGCLRAAVRVRVDDAPREDVLDGAYVALPRAAEHGERAARWLDASARALVREGAWPSVLRVAVVTDAGDAWRGRARVGDGLEGDGWRRALAAMRAGVARDVVLDDPWAPERAAASAALGTASRPAVGELSTWATATGEGASLRGAWWRACADVDGAVQRVVGRWRDAVTPRVATAWERDRGATGMVADEAWLARFVRAPGERAWCRGREAEGEAVRAWWPGPVAWAEGVLASAPR